ncbi:MAG: hypothetical protein LBU99_05625 [Spirochaetaceae bacterium]|jgi:hypothetical protein|nr:hypothetical protein [Spirochaetaceae bacterium]
MNEPDPVIRRIEQQNALPGRGYFTLHWSRLMKADKYAIVTAVPAVSGIYELYYRKKNAPLNLLSVNQGWYGGLRSQIREAIDEDFQTDKKLRSILAENDIYFRFSLSDILADMQDVLWFLHKSYFGSEVRIQPSGRYDQIYLKEYAPDNVHWI